MSTRILIVEDSPTQAVQLEEVLRVRGYETQTVANGSLALEALRRDRPALILSDVKMPVMDGFQLCRMVKQDPDLGRIPVILLTSLSATADVLSAMEAGADFYIPKPYQDGYLLEKLDAILASGGKRGREDPETTSTVTFDGTSYQISASREQMLDLLISTYEVASQQNRDLLSARQELQSQNTSLEKKVRERTAVLTMEIGERERAEEALRQLNASLEQHIRERTAELEESNTELESFSYSVSHDLRAPLRSMDGFSKILLEDYGPHLDARGTDCLARVRAGAKKMGLLIDDLLGLSRVTRSKLKREPIDLAKIARTVTARLREAEPERRVELVAPEALPALGDERLLETALNNLLGNAWKFTAKQATPQVEIGLTEVRGRSAYYIRDNGAGFDMARADNVFEPFRRLHREDEYSGTGIGLAIVQRIVRRHGGTVWAESEVGAGATFYFTLDGKQPGA